MNIKHLAFAVLAAVPLITMMAIYDDSDMTSTPSSEWPGLSYDADLMKSEITQNELDYLPEGWSVTKLRHWQDCNLSKAVAQHYNRRLSDDNLWNNRELFFSTHVQTVKKRYLQCKEANVPMVP